MVNIGIIGAGRIGRIHAETLAQRIPSAQIASIADVNLAAAQATAARYRIPAATDDPALILNDPSIDAVVIASATNTHTTFIMQAAQAGKHIFCEKPIDVSLARIDAALQAVRTAGIQLQIGFNRRFDANFRRVREAVVNGEIGHPHRVHIVSRDPSPPPIDYVRVSGGMFVDMTIHDFDMARFLIGAEVDEIYTAAGVMVDPAIGEAGDVDTAVIVLRFANGVIGTIDNSRRAVYGYDQRVEVFGDGGSISTANNFPNTAIISTAQHIRTDLPLNFFLERYLDSYAAELGAFIDAIERGTPVPVTGEDGRAPVVMALAARRSYEEGRAVKLSEIG